MFSKRPKGATVYSDKKKSGVAGLLWMLVASVITIITSMFVYKSGYIISHETETVEKTVDQPKPKKEEDYQFYKLLHDQKMSSIPNDKVKDDKNKSEKTNDKEKFEPDVVISKDLKEKNPDIEKNLDKPLEDSQSPNIDSIDAKKPVGGDVNGDNDMVIVYENSTYDGTPVKKTMKPVDIVSENEKNNALDQSLGTTGGQNNAENINDQSIYPTNTGPKIDGPVNYTGKRIGSIYDNLDGNEKNNSINPEGEKSQSNISYILQINSYGSSYEADKRRAQVLMAGVDARVIKNNTGNNTAIYQVVSNTMNSPEEVVKTQQKLQQNGIDSLIVEQRRK